MNNVSFIHLIYVNDEQRAVYDGSLQGFKKAVAKLGISISDLYHGSMHGEDTTEEVSEYLFQMHEDACWVLDSDIEGIDSLGVYLCTEGRSRDRGDKHRRVSGRIQGLESKHY